MTRDPAWLVALCFLAVKWWRQGQDWHAAARPGSDAEQLREALEAR